MIDEEHSNPIFLRVTSQGTTQYKYTSELLLFVLRAIQKICYTLAGAGGRESVT